MSRHISLVILLATVACGGTQEPPAGSCSAGQGLGQARAGVFGGGDEALYLRGSPAELDAVGLARFDDASGRTVRCTAFLVHPRWAVTAAHCASYLERFTAELHIGPSADLGRSVPVQQVEIHPVYDVALLELSTEIAGVPPVALADSDPTPLVGARVQLAGFGLTDSGEHSLRRFAVARIASVDADSLITRSVSGSGACEGDSGGPLLTRGETGALVALGSLSRGSAACNQSDQFIRADRWRDWALLRMGGAAPAQPVPCGSFDAVGQCFGDTAVWCGPDGVLHGARCTEGKSCGWSEVETGYRCVTADPCGGADTLGSCEGATLVRCEQGQRVELKCGECRVTCTEASDDGVARCDS